jgi:hypothetical protein
MLANRLTYCHRRKSSQAVSREIVLMRNIVAAGDLAHWLPVAVAPFDRLALLVFGHFGWPAVEQADRNIGLAAPH